MFERDPNTRLVTYNRQTYTLGPVYCAQTVINDNLGQTWWGLTWGPIQGPLALCEISTVRIRFDNSYIWEHESPDFLEAQITKCLDWTKAHELGHTLLMLWDPTNGGHHIPAYLGCVMSIWWEPWWIDGPVVFCPLHTSWCELD